MIIDPSDENFEPTKRFLVVIPGTGYFHVADFEELAVDLQPEYAKYPLREFPLTYFAPQPYPDALSPEELAGPAEADLITPEVAEADLQRQVLLAELAHAFVQQFNFNQTLSNPPAAAVATPDSKPKLTSNLKAQTNLKPPSLELVSGADYWPYSDTILPKSDSQAGLVVVTYANLGEMEQRLKNLTELTTFLATQTRLLLVLPLHRADLFFQMLSLAGLVQINDLSQNLEQPHQAALQ